MLGRIRSSASSTMSKSSSSTVKSASFLNSLMENAPSSKIELLEDGWTKKAAAADTDTPTAKPTGLSISLMDISGSMGSVKSAVADSCSGIMATLNVIAPGIQNAIVYYNDFDKHSIESGPVVRAPDCSEWEGGDFVKHMRKTEVCGGGGGGSEALHSSLMYVFNNMIPAFKKMHGITRDEKFPILIFVFTDEDMRIANSDTGKLCANSYDSETAPEEEFIMKTWGQKPLTILDMRKALVENDCWLRILNFSRCSGSNQSELCQEDVINFSGYDNNRWQLFESFDRRSCNVRKNIATFIMRQSISLFKNLNDQFSAFPILREINQEELNVFIESEGRSEPAGFEKYGDAQRESFKSRVLNMAPLDFGRVVQGGGRYNNHKRSVFLNCAYDSAFCCSKQTFNPQQQQQQQQSSSGGGGISKLAVVTQRAQSITGGGNAASTLALHMNACFQSLDDFGIDHTNLCDCKGCTKLMASVEATSDQGRKTKLSRKYARVHWAKMFAEKLFKMMIKEQSMMYACSAVPDEIGAIYAFVTGNNAGVCSRVSTILSDLGTECGNKAEYAFLKEGKHMKSASYDALQVINNTDLTPEQSSMFMWFYVPNDALEEAGKIFHQSFSFSNSYTGGGLLSLDEYKRFEFGQCFDFIKKLVSCLKITRNVEDVLLETSKTSNRYFAIPVFCGSDDQKEVLREELASDLFGGREDVAEMMFIDLETVIQKLGTLYDVRLSLPEGGYAAIKSVCAAASWAASCEVPSNTSNMILSIAKMAFTKYYQEQNSSSETDLDIILPSILEGTADGEIENNLSGVVFLRCLITWANKIGVDKNFTNKLEHFLALRILTKAGDSKIGEKYETFPVRRLDLSEKDLKYICKRCGVKSLKMEYDNDEKLCLRCKGNYRMGKPMVYHWDNKLTRDPRAKTASPTTLNLLNAKKIDDKVKEMASDIIGALNLPPTDKDNEIAVSAAAKAVGILYGKTCLLYKLLNEGNIDIPVAVCVECDCCKSKYMMSTLGPDKPQNRKCPWCRYANKLVAMGRGGKKLLMDLIECGAPSLAMVEEAIRTSGDVMYEELGEGEEFYIIDYFLKLKNTAIAEGNKLQQNNNKRPAPLQVTSPSSPPKKMRSDLPDSLLAAIGECAIETKEKTTANLIGLGEVKVVENVGPNDLDGKDPFISLQEYCSWDKFNSLFVNPWLGYRLDEQWDDWNTFLIHVKKNDVWKFLCNKTSPFSVVVMNDGSGLLNVDNVNVLVRQKICV
nr:MAG: immediate-early protein [White spot syndrome virus]